MSAADLKAPTMMCQFSPFVFQSNDFIKLVFVSL